MILQVQGLELLGTSGQPRVRERVCVCVYVYVCVCVYTYMHMDMHGQARECLYEFGKYPKYEKWVQNLRVFRCRLGPHHPAPERYVRPGYPNNWRETSF